MWHATRASWRRRWTAVESTPPRSASRSRTRALRGCGAPAGVGVLAMRERAEELGGRLTIESARGAGTTVPVRLPLVPGPAAGPQTGAAVTRVLLVDDHPMLREGPAVHSRPATDIEVVGEADGRPPR